MEKKIRFALMVFLTFVLVAPVAAASNQQKIFSLDSDVHQAIEFLYMAQGLGLLLGSVKLLSPLVGRFVST